MADASRIEDLRPGDHACLTFTDVEERLDLVAAFVRDGIRGGQKVVCVTDSLPQAALRSQLSERGLPVNDATGSGQMSVLASGETYLAGGSFGSARMIRLLAGRSPRRSGTASPDCGSPATCAGPCGRSPASRNCWTTSPR